MNRLTVQSMIALLLATYMSIGWAASPVIGVAMARGDFSVDHSNVTGNVTLFSGNTVETQTVPSQLRLNNGARMTLFSDSRGKVYQDRLVLEKGSGQFETLTNYKVEALSLQVLGTQPNCSAQVSVKDSKTLLVAALTNGVRVANAHGVVVANLIPGRALEFDPQAGAAAPTTMTGCLRREVDRYLYTDETSNLTVELQGAGLDKEVGSRIQITGTVVPGATPAAGASQVIQVTDIKHLGRCPAAARAGGAAGGAAAAGVGLTSAAKAVVAGVVIAGAAVAVGVAASKGGTGRGELSPATP